MYYRYIVVLAMELIVKSTTLLLEKPFNETCHLKKSSCHCPFMG
jgi:hypothetical protein